MTGVQLLGVDMKGADLTDAILDQDVLDSGVLKEAIRNERAAFAELGDIDALMGCHRLWLETTTTKGQYARFDKGDLRGRDFTRERLATASFLGASSSVHASTRPR